MKIFYISETILHSNKQNKVKCKIQKTFATLLEKGK